jgi:hypothetical protein
MGALASRFRFGRTILGKRSRASKPRAICSVMQNKQQEFPFWPGERAKPNDARKVT